MYTIYNAISINTFHSQKLYDSSYIIIRRHSFRPAVAAWSDASTEVEIVSAWTYLLGLSIASGWHKFNSLLLFLSLSWAAAVGGGANGSTGGNDPNLYVRNVIICGINAGGANSRCLDN